MNPFDLRTDEWMLFTLYIDGANSFAAVDLDIDLIDSGTPSCPTPLSVTLLPRRSQEYDQVYLRDFIVYGSGMHPGALLHLHHSFEMPSRSLIDVHFPLSVSEMSLKNIAHSPETIATVQYNEINRNPAVYALETGGDIDMYRWRYAPGVTDLPTLCEPGYQRQSNQCVSKIFSLLREERVPSVLLIQLLPLDS